jgi:hypothetical protein
MHSQWRPSATVVHKSPSLIAAGNRLSPVISTVSLTVAKTICFQVRPSSPKLGISCAEVLLALRQCLSASHPNRRNRPAAATAGFQAEATYGLATERLVLQGGKAFSPREGGGQSLPPTQVAPSRERGAFRRAAVAEGATSD